MHHPEREVRLVDDHMRGAEVARIPAPALHIGEDRLDLPGGIAFLGACGAAQFRERRLELAILLVLRAEGVEHLARILRSYDGVEDVRRLGRGLRQLDVAADAGVGETAGLHVAGVGEHRLRELEIGFRQCLGREAGKSRDLVVAELEPIGIGVLQPSDGGAGARILDAVIEPKRSVVAALIERLGCGALLLVGKNSIRGRGEEVADLFRNRALGRIERGIGSTATAGCASVGLADGASIACCSAGDAAGSGAVLSAFWARLPAGIAARISARAVPARMWS